MSLSRQWMIQGLTAAAVVAAVSATPSWAQNGDPVPVTVSTVVQRSIPGGQTFVGTVEPLRTSIVGGTVEERVVEYPIREGDYVRQGQMLARLRDDTIRLELAAARAELEVRRHELAELENGSRPEEIAQGRAQLGRAQAMRNYARARHQRTLSLAKSRSISAEELDETLSNVDQAEQAYREAEAALALLLEGPRPEQIAQACARVQVQEEEVRRLEDLLEQYTIVAPFDGYVVAEHTQVGQWISRGEPVAEIVELDQVDVAIPVLEDYISELVVGTPARVELGALRDETFTGEVAQIVPRADLRARTFPVKIRLENVQQDGLIVLKAGMFARVTLPVGQIEQALLVDKDAVVLGGPSPVVYVVTTDPGSRQIGTVQPVSVALGVASDGLIQVKGPLQPGQTVVVHGNERLQSHQKVAVIRRIDPPEPTAVAQRDATRGAEPRANDAQ